MVITLLHTLFTRYRFDKQGVSVELLNRFDTLQRLYVSHDRLENFTRYIISPTKKYILNM